MNPRWLPGAPIRMYAPDQHDPYDGLFNISAGSHLHGGDGCTIYPRANKRSAAGEVNPATEMNPRNRPNREVFMHFFGMEVTWR